MDYDIGLLRGVRTELHLRGMRPPLQPGLLQRPVHRAQLVQLRARLDAAGRVLRAPLPEAVPERRLLFLAERLRLQARLR